MNGLLKFLLQEMGSVSVVGGTRTAAEQAPAPGKGHRIHEPVIQKPNRQLLRESQVSRVGCSGVWVLSTSAWNRWCSGF